MCRQVDVPAIPSRIISLVPSQTELLFDLGAWDSVVGITRFCTHPKEECKQKVRVGGTKQLNLEVIEQLQPDLIIGNKEENEKEQLELLMERFPVWMSDILSIDDAVEMIVKIGGLVNKTESATSIAENIQQSFSALRDYTRNLYPSLKVAYFIWKDPYMVAARNTFINSVLELSNLENCFKSLRYPVITASELREADPDLILLSSEPYPFKEKHLQEFKSICPRAKVLLADGEMFSWYGSRLQYSVKYICSLLKEIF